MDFFITTASVTTEIFNQQNEMRISDEIIFLKNNLKNCNAKKVECKKDYRFVMKKYKDKYLSQ